MMRAGGRRWQEDQDDVDIVERLGTLAVTVRCSTHDLKNKQMLVVTWLNSN
tara:strand:+ start:418 stop:570 length:153 start_codon:yes stop_codon:yes gene_type:complete